MKKSFLIMSIIVVSILALTLVSAFWPFTGRTVDSSTSTTATASCVDSDEGNEPYEFGGVLAVNSAGETTQVNDSCTSATKVREQFCSGKRIRYRDMKCKAGCEEGACKGTCRESDSGFMPSEGGVILGAGTTGSEKILLDTCGDNNLTEAYCKKAKAKTVNIKCRTPCETEEIEFEGETYEVGSCEMYFACIDNDGGKNLETKGRVQTWNLDNEVITNTTDVCLDSERLLEVGCSRRTCESEASSVQTGKIAIDALKFREFYDPVGVARDMMGGEECEWTFAANSTKYTRVHYQVKKCQYGCENGACRASGTVGTITANPNLQDFCLNTNKLMTFGTKNSGAKVTYKPEKCDEDDCSLGTCTIEQEKESTKDE